ncbi:HD domain-containing protein [Candidatus Peregrinibacteria bacterium]|nr:HD domain-containing protein [Candidatus Peregrinibacteria bacterium]
MSETQSQPDRERVELRDKIKTSEYETCKPFLAKLNLLSREELEKSWGSIYLEEYILADSFRQKGAHDLALAGYRKLQVLLDFVKKAGIESDDILCREGVCHYQVIQCYYNLQSENDSAKRELYLFSEVLVAMLNCALKGHPKAPAIVSKLTKLLSEEKQISVLEIYIMVTDFWTVSKGKMDVENMGWVWKLAYFINRYCSISHDFYLLCTPHVKDADSYSITSKSSGDFAREVLKLLPDEYIKKSNPNKVFAQQTRTWLSFYPDVLSAHRNILTGDGLNTTLDFSEEIRERLKKSVNNYVSQQDSYQDEYIQDFEYNLELLALCYFATAYTYPQKYQQELINLKIIYSIAEEYYLERIQQIIQIYIARLAVGNGYYHDADKALGKGYDLRKRDRKINNGYDHILDKWLDVLNCENLLQKHRTEQTIVQQKDNIHASCIDEAELEFIEDTQFNSHDHIDKIKQIEEFFAEYTHPKAKINLKRGVFLPLEARTYFLLGRVNVEKVKIFRKDLSEDKDSKIGRELLDAFEKARNYLCEAFSILKQMEYSELEMLDDITNEYIEMVRLNYQLSGLFDNEIDKRLPKRNEMDKIVTNFELQKCVEIIFEAIQTNSIDPRTDYSKQIATFVEKGLMHIIPEVRSLYIVTRSEEEWDLSQFQKEDMKAAVNHTLVNSAGEGLAKFDFYHTKHGKIMLCIKLDKSEKRKMILEIDIPLNEHANNLLLAITNLITKLLKHFDLRKELEESTYAEYKKNKSNVLESAHVIFEDLFFIHKPTLTHSRDVANMLLISAHEIKNEDPNAAIDEEEIYYAGLLHDIGKLDLDPFLILDKASKLLPYERERVEQHALCTVKVLRGLLGFKDFKNLIALAVSHHINYGVEQGYPFCAIGDDIQNVLRNLCMYFFEHDKDFLTDEEKIILTSEESKLPEPYCKLARDIVILDQLQAIRAADRNYRIPIPLDQFEGYLLSRIGRDFDPKRALKIIELIKNGQFSVFIARTPTESKSLKNLKTTLLIDWDDILEFLIQNKNLLEEICGIPYNAMIQYFKIGRGRNLQIGYSALRSGFCQIFIDHEKTNGLSDDEAREAGKKKFFPLEERIFNFVKEYFKIAA